MYLRQRCSDTAVNKTILKPCIPAVMEHANTYTWDFPDMIKFHIATLIRYRRKQSGLSIQTIIWIGLKSSSVRPCPDICRHATFHPNPCTQFWVTLLTDKHGQKNLPPPLSEVNNWLCDSTTKQWTYVIHASWPSAVVLKLSWQNSEWITANLCSLRWDDFHATSRVVQLLSHTTYQTASCGYLYAEI